MISSGERKEFFDVHNVLLDRPVSDLVYRCHSQRASQTPTLVRTGKGCIVCSAIVQRSSSSLLPTPGRSYVPADIIQTLRVRNHPVRDGLFGEAAGSVTVDAG